MDLQKEALIRQMCGLDSSHPHAGNAMDAYKLGATTRPSCSDKQTPNLLPEACGHKSSPTQMRDELYVMAEHLLPALRGALISVLHAAGIDVE